MLGWWRRSSTSPEPPPRGGDGGPLRQRLVFVGGKGGVGKTSTAAALALLAAEQGQRCLIVSTDPAHSLGDIFERPIGGRETVILPNLTALEIDPDAEADRYLGTVKQSLRSLVSPALFDEIDRQMDLARLAPGALEAALLERMAELLTRDIDRFDRIVFDTAPTGHTLRLLMMPEVMAAYTDALLHRHERADRLGQILERMEPAPRADDLGHVDRPEDKPRDERAARIREILLARRRRLKAVSRLLLDPAETAFLLVLNPERLPILESRRTVEVLERFGIPIAALVVNRVLPENADGEFLRTRREQEARYLEEIERDFARLPRLRLPLMPRDVRGIAALREIAGLLAERWPA